MAGYGCTLNQINEENMEKIKLYLRIHIPRERLQRLYHIT